MFNVDMWHQRFIEYMVLRGWSPRTQESYTAQMRHFLAYLEVCEVESLSSVTRDTVEGYRVFLFERRQSDGRPLMLKTQSAALSAVKAFLRFLWRQRFILIDPGAGIELPRVPQTLPRVLLSEAEVRQLLERSSIEPPLGLRNRAALELLYGTGIRAGELCALTVDAMDFERREVRVHDGKGGKSRVLPLGDMAGEWLRSYLDAERSHLARSKKVSALFLSWRGKPLQRGALERMVHDAAVQAGLTKPVTPHVLRHCCATHMLRHGASLRHIQDLLGHASLSTTQRYTKVEVTDLRRVLIRCHPRERSGPR